MGKERTDPLVRNLRKLVAKRAHIRRRQREFDRLSHWTPEYF